MSRDPSRSLASIATALTAPDADEDLPEWASRTPAATAPAPAPSEPAAPGVSDAMRREVVAAVGRFAQTFGVRGKNLPALASEFAFGLARASVRADDVHEIASEVIASSKYFPRLAELLEAEKAIRRRRFDAANARRAQSAAANPVAFAEAQDAHRAYERCCAVCGAEVQRDAGGREVMEHFPAPHGWPIRAPWQASL